MTSTPRHNLRTRRKEAGLTQRELAEAIGLPLRTLQHYEQRNNAPLYICLAAEGGIHRTLAEWRWAAQQAHKRPSRRTQLLPPIDNLTDIQKAAELTQRELAQAIGLSFRTLQNYEQRNNAPLYICLAAEQAHIEKMVHGWWLEELSELEPHPGIH